MDSQQPIYTDSTAFDYAWAAGFLDGEGYFALAKRTAKYSRPHSRLAHVTASQIHLRPLERLQGIFGGKIYTHRKTTGGNQLWCWDLHRPLEVVRCIKAIHPYLVLKPEEAMAVHDYALTVRGVGRRLSDDQIAERESIIVRFDLARERI